MPSTKITIGDNITIKQLSNMTGLSYWVIYSRIKNGWSYERIINTPKYISQDRNKDRLYHVWQGMKARCSPNANATNSKWYAKKGIKVCEEWQNDFLAFRKWALSNGYDYSKNRKEQSLDRIDNNGDYSPTNCRWVTHSENCKNTSRNVFLEHNGEKKCINDWSKETGIPLETIRGRMKNTDNTEEILGFSQIPIRSNTKVKGISRLKKNGLYVIYIEHKYIGCERTLEDAIKRKEKYLNEQVCSQ